MPQTLIARVRLLSSVRATDRDYDYKIPEGMNPFRGAVVKVPFGRGNRERYGVITALIREEPALSLKELSELFPPEIGLNEEMMALCDYLQRQIFCSFGEAARAILPSPVYRKEKKSSRFLSLCASDWEEKIASLRGKNRDRYRELLQYLSLMGETEEKQCRELFDLDHAAVLRLEAKGLIAVSEKEEARDPVQVFLSSREPREAEPLSPQQEKAFEELRELLDREEASAALLHGVTGSGKTRVMLALCERALQQGKTVLFLVPEIALTGQSARLLTLRYGDQVAIIHSALSEGERRDTYVAIRQGKKSIVLGTRSAIFAPLNRLGLIIIDEEQDQSYKSDTQLKYHARDVARFRCAQNRAMLLLASATPDIESYYKAECGKYRLVTMNQRYGSATLPDVKIVDLRSDLRKNPSFLMGEALRSEIRANLEAGEQSILLMNRRGYRRFLSCTHCGEVIRCPNCSVSLTLHNGPRQRLSCHYCGYAAPLPNRCPSCGGEHLTSHGYGIQQLEEELNAVFPQARILRMDSDSVTAKNSHETMLRAFTQKEADILIGTQMVAKGHNFPDVTLVGIVMADSALYLSDYRAGEHCFSLLTQVIGRAGRAEKKGRALIQTLNPRHNIFSLASAQDYRAFYEGEIAVRRSFQFPPFCDLAVFTLASEQEKEVLSGCRFLSEAMDGLLHREYSDVKLIVYGPFEAPVYRLKNVYRKRFILKYKNNKRTREFISRLLADYAAAEETARIVPDVNPGLI